jgi:hypothetical protein
MDSKVSATAIAYLYALMVGGAYLVGYWLPFGLNILAFADLSDIIKASVLPTLPAVGLLLTYSAIDGLNSISRKQHDEYIAEGGFFKYYMKFMVFYGHAMTGAFLLYAAYLVITEPAHQKLKGVFPLASLLVFIYLIYGNRHLLALDVKSRVFAISILCFLPTAAFVTATVTAMQPRQPLPPLPTKASAKAAIATATVIAATMTNTATATATTLTLAVTMLSKNMKISKLRRSIVLLGFQKKQE